jgi:hypothetical protein
MELGILGIVAACFVALVYKLFAMSKADTSVDRQDEAKIARAANSRFEVYRLERAKSEEETKNKLDALAKTGATETLVIDLEQKQNEAEHGFEQYLANRGADIDKRGK